MSLHFLAICGCLEWRIRQHCTCRGERKRNNRKIMCIHKERAGTFADWVSRSSEQNKWFSVVIETALRFSVRIEFTWDLKAERAASFSLFSQLKERRKKIGCKTWASTKVNSWLDEQMRHARDRSKHARRCIRRSLASTAVNDYAHYSLRSQSIWLHSIVVRIVFIWPICFRCFEIGDYLRWERQNLGKLNAQLRCCELRKCEMMFHHQNGKLSFAYSRTTFIQLQHCEWALAASTRIVYGRRRFSSHCIPWKQLAKRVDLCFVLENERNARKPWNGVVCSRPSVFAWLNGPHCAVLRSLRVSVGCARAVTWIVPGHNRGEKCIQRRLFNFFISSLGRAKTKTRAIKHQLLRSISECEFFSAKYQLKKVSVVGSVSEWAVKTE